MHVISFCILYEGYLRTLRVSICMLNFIKEGKIHVISYATVITEMQSLLHMGVYILLCHPLETVVSKTLACIKFHGDQ